MQKQVAVNVQRRGECQRGEGVLKNVEKLEQIEKWANGLALSLSLAAICACGRVHLKTQEKNAEIK